MSKLMRDIERFFDGYFSKRPKTNIIIEASLRAAWISILKAAAIDKNSANYSSVTLPTEVAGWLKSNGYDIKRKDFFNEFGHIETIDVIVWDRTVYDNVDSFDGTNFPTAPQLSKLQQTMREEIKGDVWPALSNSHEWIKNPIVINKELCNLTRYHIENTIKFRTRVESGKTILELPIRAELRAISLAEY